MEKQPVRPIDANAIVNYHVTCTNGQEYVLLPVKTLAEYPTLDYVPRQQWISVKDRLPEADPENIFDNCTFSKDLLVYVGEKVRAAYYCHTTKEWRDNVWEDDVIKVEYWMDNIPEPPKEAAHA